MECSEVCLNSNYSFFPPADGDCLDNAGETPFIALKSLNAQNCSKWGFCIQKLDDKVVELMNP